MPMTVLIEIEIDTIVCVCVRTLCFLIFARVCFRLWKRNTTNCRRPFLSFHWSRETFSSIPSPADHKVRTLFELHCWAKSAHRTNQEHHMNQANKSDEVWKGKKKKKKKPTEI